MSSTAQDLVRRLWVLLALGAVSTLALFGAYRGVHADAVPLASASTPGVVAVVTAQNALQEAQESAVQSGVAGVPGTSDASIKLAVANQSLGVAASDRVTGLDGQQTLATVDGLLTVYSGWIEKANREPAGSPLQDAYFHTAATVLDGNSQAHPTNDSLLGRLAELQRRQEQVVDQQAEFGWPLWIGWAAVVLICGSFCLALVETQRFTRRRFRHRWNRPLAAATVLLVAGVLVLALFTWWTHDGLTDSAALLNGAVDGRLPNPATVKGHMSGAGPRAAVANWILAGGVVLMVLIAAGLVPRISEYRLRSSR
ncbi:hypothetical protein HY68_17930 [Streptomyces sp. AcH 505]|uniref:hypothetical protein n=1 Tax=Streptomyces sp. AcH 505 TaxID=352211 RepID=UPI000591CEF2|nr:hypothetical protein HY68_17930 [Streptomyces sp. AcH 505]